MLHGGANVPEDLLGGAAIHGSQGSRYTTAKYICFRK
jgi:hypothetical protein